MKPSAFTIVVGTTKERLFSFDLRHMTLHSHLFKNKKNEKYSGGLNVKRRDMPMGKIEKRDTVD